MHEEQIHVIGPEGFQRGVNALRDAVVPCVVELGGQPDLVAWYARRLDTGANLGLVTISMLV